MNATAPSLIVAETSIISLVPVSRDRTSRARKIANPTASRPAIGMNAWSRLGPWGACDSFYDGTGGARRTGAPPELEARIRFMNCILGRARSVSTGQRAGSKLRKAPWICNRPRRTRADGPAGSGRLAAQSRSITDGTRRSLASGGPSELAIVARDWATGSFFATRAGARAASAGMRRPPPACQDRCRLGQ